MFPSEVFIHTDLPSVEVTLLDHAGGVVATSTGELRVSGLAAGIYRVQVEAGPATTEEFLTVESGASIQRRVDPVVQTVTPVKSVSTNNAAHSWPAQRLSMQPLIRRGSGARLVVFVRTIREWENYPPTIRPDDLDVLDATLQTLTSDKQEWELGPGYAAVSLEVDPGAYLLRSTSGGGSTNQSVTTLPGWTTYLFMPAWPDDDTGEWNPSVNALVAHMTRLDTPFEPYDYNSDAIFAAEMALDGLRAGRAAEPHMRHTMLQRTSLELNPMLGIYLGHAWLAQPHPPLGRLRRLVRDLRAVIPGHPDVDGLHVALKDRDHDFSGSRVTPISAPPMLRSSYQAMIQRDSREPRLILDGSMAEIAATQLLNDGVWARWVSTLDASSLDLVTVRTSFVDDAARAITWLFAPASKGEGTSRPAEWSPAAPSKEYEQITPQLAQLAGFMQQIAHFSKVEDEPIRPDELSRQLGLPIAQVGVGLRALDDASSHDVPSFVELL